MSGYNLRGINLKGLIKNKNTLECLHKLDILTVDDLLSCKFIRLMKQPAVLEGWDDITKIVIRLRIAEGATHECAY